MQRNNAPALSTGQAVFRGNAIRSNEHASRQRLELELLKHRLVLRFLDETPQPEFHVVVIRAAAEAASLAWLTPFPLLVFPGLFEEQVRAAWERGVRQEQVRQRS